MADTVVDPVGGNAQWAVSLLPDYTQVGHIDQNGKMFVVQPKTGSVLDGVNEGPYASKDEAMQAISTHTGGICRDMNPET